MTNGYTLNDALKYVEKIDKINDYNILDLKSFSDAIKFFADNNDEINFKKLTDKCLDLIKNSKYVNEEHKKNPLSFLEFICSGIDSGFTQGYLSFLGLESLKGKEGNTQKMFKKLYSPKKGSGDYFG